ncbi:HIT family protein [Patescibacteria group bacterium]|nr:HIT family protein [Patescibacteria group bacterium]
MEDCLFCKIVNGEIPCDKIYEDEDFLAFLDISPMYYGHTLLVTKKHFKDISEVPFEILSKYLNIANLIAKALCKTLDVEDYNIRINKGKSAGQIIFHVHLHILPRMRGDACLNNFKYKDLEKKKLLSKIKENLI